MKLIILITVFACSYAAKLDRTYLPPANAATAGGTPGSLTAPGSGQPDLPAGPSSFAKAVEQQFRAQSGPNFQSSKPGFESTAPQYQPTGPQFGQSGVSTPEENPAFGQAPTAFSANQGPQEATFSGQYQPERAQASADRNAETLRNENQIDGDSFAYSYETSNGIAAEESGVATNGVQAQGGYSYTGDDGQQYRVTYTADENGYQPQGEHLPTPHPIPEEILRSIQENARAAAAGNQEGAYNPEDESDFAPQQYSGAGSPSYQGQIQPSGQATAGAYKPGQGSTYQNGAPNSFSGSPKSSGPQGYQYQAGSNQGPTQKAPTAPGFSFPRGQVQDQGPSPSTPTEVNSAFVPSGPRQSTQLQGQFGVSTPAFSGSIGQGQSSNQDQSGYQYNTPQSSSFGRTSQGPGQYSPQQSEARPSDAFKPQPQGPGQYRPQQSEAQPSDAFKPQPQGPAYSRPQFAPANGPASPSGLNAQGLSQQGFGPAGSNAPGLGNSPTFGPSGVASGPASPNQASSFPRPNGAPSYSPTGPSASPSTPQGSAFSRPSTSDADQGYVYGPGTGPTGSFTTKTSPNGQGFAPSGPSGPAFPGSSQGSFPRGSAPQGSTPDGSAQPSQPAYSRPSGPAVGPIGTAGPNTQGQFGAAPQYQRTQPSSQGPSFSAAPGSAGSATPSSQGPFGAAPQYQRAQPSTSAQSQGPSFSRPSGSTVGPTSANAQRPFGGASQPSGPKFSMPQAAPYQYNRPGSQSPQSQNPQSGSPDFRAPEGRPGQTFGGPRQPPSFSPEEGYKY